MSPCRHIAVLDIGKTNAKVILLDAENFSTLDSRRIANPLLSAGAYPHHDCAYLWDFIQNSLQALNRAYPIDAISVTTHGATAALLRQDGETALPIMDYEHPIPAHWARKYKAHRPSFLVTGSPPLPGGLNLGRQLFWQQQAFPKQFATVKNIVTYPQYWGFRLSGAAANEVTSLGCHTDLWDYQQRDFSSLVDRMGWRKQMASVKPAGEILGMIQQETAKYLNLAKTIPVYNGMHDSNASLLPHLITDKPPFSVVSTGTWVVAMAIGSDVKTIKSLNPAQDTLVNINLYGEPTPSARFMGGREYQQLLARSVKKCDAETAMRVALQQTMLMPAVVPGCGPYPHRITHWVGKEPVGGARYAAVCFYLALMTAACLKSVGADGRIIVEGPFSANHLYLAMLATAANRPVAPNPGAATGACVGAAMLVAPTQATNIPPLSVFRHNKAIHKDALKKYAKRWFDLLAE